MSRTSSAINWMPPDKPLHLSDPRCPHLKIGDDSYFLRLVYEWPETGSPVGKWGMGWRYHQNKAR